MLGQAGGFFGERALLKKEKRFAGIRAHSAQLHTMCITRDGFERALGAPFEEIVPDRYRLNQKEVFARLSGVSLFGAMTAHQLQLMVETMVPVNHSEGEWVFQQDDIGDSFYIIVKGNAEVVRVEEPGTTPTTLTSLGLWESFGERALLLDERRYAGVRAASKHLHLLKINREAFTSALGSVDSLLPHSLLKEVEYQ